MVTLSAPVDVMSGTSGAPIAAAFDTLIGNAMQGLINIAYSFASYVTTLLTQPVVIGVIVGLLLIGLVVGKLRSKAGDLL